MGSVGDVEPQQFLLKLAPSGVAPKTRSTGFTPEQTLWYVLPLDAFSWSEKVVHRLHRRTHSAACHRSLCFSCDEALMTGCGNVVRWTESD